MVTHRLFYLLIVITLCVVTACAPQAASTPIMSETTAPSTMEALPIPKPTLTPTASSSVETSPLEFRGHTADVWSVDISPDGKYLVTASDDKTARLWDLATGQTLQVFSPCKAEQGGARFSPDGKSILVGCMDHTAYLIDIAGGQTVQTFSGHAGGVDWVDFSPDGKRIITAGGDDQTARIWDAVSGQTLFILKSNTDYLPRVAFSPDGKYVFTDGLWDATTGEAIQTFPKPSAGVSSVAFSPDSKYVATGSDDRVARVWDLSTGQMVREFTGHQGFINGIKFSPDGKLLLTGSADHRARLWDIATGQTIRVFSGHRGGVQGVTFSPDGKLVAAASDDTTVMVWNLEDLSASASAPSGITLHLAVSDGGGRPSEPYVLEFIEQVKTISNGSVVIEPIWEAGNETDAGFEVGVIQLVKEGKAELGLAGSRAFDLEGITSFQALQAPFLIDNDDLSKAVATSDIATRMLDSLTSAGVIGLTMWPEDLRHPFSLMPDKPILSPEDFAGLNVRVTPSDLSYMLIDTFGGAPMMGDNDYQAAESGLRQGASLTGTPTATGNVVFFAKFQVLFANGAALEKLSEEQRLILRKTAAAIQEKAISEHPSDVEVGAAWCADGGSIVMASDEQIAAFEAAAKPVFDMIEQDPLNAELINAIRELKANIEPSPGAEACGS